MSKVSRQALWQKKNPQRQKLIRAKSKVKARFQSLKLGYGMTHEEIYDYIESYEKRHGIISDSLWWLIYEYLDWKYNNSKICGSYDHAK